MPEKIPKTIGLVPNPTKPKALEMIPGVIKSLQRLGINQIVNLQINKNTGKLVPIVELADNQPETGGQRIGFNDADFKVEDLALIIVFGGDGTYLSVARAIAGKDIPLMGVNLGRLGFLTEIQTWEITSALREIIQGNYSVKERIMVQAQVYRQQEMIHSATGLNDVIVANTGLARMVELEIFIDDEFLNSYPADGLIVATPTGSTAYSLSAGGPIVNPFTKTLIITPICPHTLYSRSLVISKDEVVRVVIKSDHGQCGITIDGQFGWSLKQSDEIVIQAASQVVKSVQMPGHTPYKILRDKMRGDRV